MQKTTQNIAYYFEIIRWDWCVAGDSMFALTETHFQLHFIFYSGYTCLFVRTFLHSRSILSWIRWIWLFLSISLDSSNRPHGHKLYTQITNSYNSIFAYLLSAAICISYVGEHRTVNMTIKPHENAIKIPNSQFVQFKFSQRFTLNRTLKFRSTTMACCIRITHYRHIKNM